MSTALSAYRKVANPNEALVYEQQQNLEIPVDADENTLVELQANASEFVLVGPSSAIVEVRMEHLDVANVNPFTEERQPIARYYVKSYATNSWAVSILRYNMDRKFRMCLIQYVPNQFLVKSDPKRFMCSSRSVICY